VVHVATESVSPFRSSDTPVTPQSVFLGRKTVFRTTTSRNTVAYRSM
jgi:hypothetical protein